MLKIIKKKRAKLFKMLHVFTMTAMILNMSMVGVFFTGAENALACSGTVKVDKVTVPSGSDQEFSFVAKYNSAANQNFNLRDASPLQTLNFSSTGTYVISEVPVAGWELQSIVCTAVNSVTPNFTYVNDLPNAKTTLTIAHDTNITCVFTNKQVPTNICGDGVRTDDEQCDDGNAINNDVCSNQCLTQTPICHATEAGGNPFNFIWVDSSAIDGIGANDHTQHAKDIINITDLNSDGQINVADCDKTLDRCGDGNKTETEQCDLGALNGTFNSGCNSDCTNDCKMELTKTDFVTSVEPGGNLDYKIVLKNTGVANCTGSGVELREIYDAKTAFVSSLPAPYSGNNYWNYTVIAQGEEREVNIKTLVSTSATCGSELNNKVCAWAQEWGTKGLVGSANWLCVEEKTPVVCVPKCGDGLRNQDSEQCDDGNLVSDDGCSSTCQTELYDFGDAIDFYHTLKTSNGASHKLGSGLFLGASVGDELTGQPSVNADGDDANATIDDEDGVTFTSLLERGFTATVKVNATATGKLSAWIDFNRDNDWSDAGEKIFNDVVLVAGDNSLSFNVPGVGVSELGDTYARFRFSSAGGLNFDGPALDGEVEDYKVKIEDRPTKPFCGDHIQQLGEDCDDGLAGSATCTTNCETLDDYCGDGVRNLTWEECDGADTEAGKTCTAQCQFEDNDCDDKIFARVNVNGILNGTSGDMTSYIYLGSATNIIPAGKWFLVSGAFADSDIASYEDVSGLAVQRLNGSVRAVMHGSRTGDSTVTLEHVNGNIEFFNANVTAQRSDTGNNILENPSDGTGVGSYVAGNDEVWVSAGDTTKSNFWLTTTTEDDGFYSDYGIINDCQGQITVCKYRDSGSAGTIGVYDGVATDSPLEWAMMVAGPNGYSNNVTTNRASGCYTLRGLKYGTYDFEEVLPSEGTWVNSLPADASRKLSATISKTETTKNVTFLNYEAEGSLTICKYEDKGILGEYEFGTDPVLNWNMTIDGPNYHQNISTGSTCSGSICGCVTVNDLPHGTYTVTEDQSNPLWENSLPGTGTYNVTIDRNNFNPTRIFLNYKPNRSIKICKYNDINVNGFLDIATDTPMVWGMRVQNTTGYNETFTTEADSGCKVINNLPRGTYTVTEDFDVNSNWVNSLPGNYKYEVALNSTTNYHELNFLNYQKLGKIKVCKYEDRGVIGTYEADKDSPKAWKMTIKNASSTVVATTTTDSLTGCATVDGLPYGDYFVSEEVKANWNNSVPGNYASIPVTISAVETKNATFLNYQPAGSISGIKYHDVNRNGVIEMGEEKLAGWEIQLVRCPYAPLNPGQLTFLDKPSINLNPAPGLTGFCSVVATTTTAFDGSYSFSGLSSGDYRVSEVLTTNWTQSVPAGNKNYYFNLGLNEATSTIDFANYTNPGSITVCKKLDTDGYLNTDTDRNLPADEWQFTLSQNEINLSTASTTIETGCTTFSGLSAGTYTVTETQQSGYSVLSPASGKQDVVVAIAENKTVEFINHQQPTVCSEKIKGYKKHAWTDAGLEGWTINLANETGGTIRTQVTDKDGYFEFGGLCFGGYIVTEVNQFGWEQVTPGSTQDYRFVVNASWGGNNHVTFKNQPTVHGCKYNDANNNGIIETGEPKLGDWTIELYECSSAMPEVKYDLQPLNSNLGCTLAETQKTETATTSPTFGCYEFKNLNTQGNYYVREVNQSGWLQTYPAGTGTYQFSYGSDTVATYDFANYKQPVCGDKVCNNNENCTTCVSDCGECQPSCGDKVCSSGENCSNCSTDCGGCGGGGGGGGDELLIVNAQVIYDCTGATISWLTSKPATTQVVYGITSQPNANSIGAPEYGYASSTPLISEKKTGHTVVIPGLKPGQAYYFRATASAGTEKKISKELVIAKTPTDCIVVKGEEGKPVLEIKKDNAQNFANPGDKNVEYIITIKNNGNLTAFDVNLVDTLPEGLTYSEDGKTSHTWSIGDLAPGETKAVTYTIDVSPEADYKTYTNIAVANASNHGPVSDDADLDVLEIKVLAETGFDVKEFIILASLLFTLVGASIFLKKKMV